MVSPLQRQTAQKLRLLLEKSKYNWKTEHKLRVFNVFLPTILRDFVPAVHRAILRITFALRRLDGLVVSVDEATRLGVLPGSHVIPKGTLDSVNKDLVLGIVMLEGCVPTSVLNTTLHHVLHFGESTMMNG